MRNLVALAATVLLVACAAQPTQRKIAESPVPSLQPVGESPSVAQPEPDLSGTEDALLYNLLVGEISGQREQFQTSAAHYIAAARQSADARLAQRATQVALFAKQFEIAIEAANLWARLDPKATEADQVLTALYLQRGDRNAAREPLRRLLDHKGVRSSDDYLVLAEVFRQGTDHRPILEMMEEILLQRPDDGDALYAYVVIAIRMGELEKALERSTHLAGLQPKSVKATLLHAQVLLLTNRTADAVTFLTGVVTRLPDEFEPRLTLARLLVDRDDNEPAYRHFSYLNKLRPNDDDVLFALALLELRLKKYADSERHLQALRKLDSTPDRTVYYLGRLAEEQKNYAAALDWYGQIDSEPYGLDTVLRRAGIHGKLGELRKAIEVLHSLSGRTAEEQVTLITVEVDLLIEANESDKAIAVAMQALQTFPDNISLIFAIGMAYEKLGNLNLMEQHMRRVLSLEPENAHALNALGYTFADRGVRLDEAHALISRAVAIEPENPFILDSMGWIEYRLGRHRTAIDHLKKALAISSDPEIYAHLAEVLWNLGEIAEARRVVKQGLEQTPDNERILNVMRKLAL